MKTIINDSLDARYNLALEEHVLTNLKEDFVFLWQSNNSVIVGKNQITVDEINAEYVKQENVNVVRRISGGGAVYHDLGNINFSYIVNDDDGSNTFRKFTSYVIEALKSYDIPAEFSGKNDITVNGMKISGNAQAIRRNRLLHHGTLLFNSDLTKLGKILKPKMDKLESNGVSSIESRVTNILPYFKEGYAPTIVEFKDRLLKKLLQIKDEDEIMPLNIYKLDHNDKNEIDDLIKNKYSTDAWNYDNIEVPSFNVNKYCRYEGSGGITFRLKIVDEKIENVKISGDFLGWGDISDIENSLKNVTFQCKMVKKKLRCFNLKKYFGNITLDNILDCLFNNNNNNNNNNNKKGFGVVMNSLKKSNFKELGSNLVEYNTTSKKRSTRIKNFIKTAHDTSGAPWGSANLRIYYTEEHFWAKEKSTGSNVYRVGITDYGQGVLGDITHVELPDFKSYNANDVCGCIESVKTVTDIFSPLTGTVVSTNTALSGSPEILNTDRYENGWIFELQVSNLDDLNTLLSENQYKNLLT